MKNTLAKQIFNYRVEHDLSQLDFSKLCKVSYSTINKIENGYIPTLFIQRKIEKFIME